MPGLSRDHVELAVEDSRLTIQGRREARPGAGDAVHYHQVERGHGTFRRMFEFTDRSTAIALPPISSDGVLTITVPKVPPPPPRKIEVR